MHTIVYAEVWINDDTHDEVLPYIGVEQGCPLSLSHYLAHTLMNSKHLDEIDGESPHLFNTFIAIILYVVLSKFGAGLQRLFNKPNEFCTYSSLEVKFSRTKITIFGHNKRKLKIKIQLRYLMNTNTLELIFIHMHTLSHLVKNEESHVWKPWWTLWGKKQSSESHVGNSNPIYSRL